MTRSIPDQLIQKTASILSISEDIVESVIDFKHQSIKEAMEVHDSIEDSGLGTFSLYGTGIRNRVKGLLNKQRFLNKLIEEGADKERIEKKLEYTSEEIEYLKERLNEFEANTRGSKESVLSSRAIEGSNRED